MKPYFQTDDGSIRIFHARWEDVLAAGVFKPKDIALVHADPPYGVNEQTNRGAKGRGHHTEARNWSPVAGDDQPFSPRPILDLDRPTILWGANHYSDRVPGSPSWIVWDKRGDILPDDNADCELAWSNLGGPVRQFTHLWKGTCRASEKENGGKVLHATQKPEALSEFVFAHAEKRKKLKRGDTVLIPYMGSFPDARPAIVRGYKVIACEVAREYCDTAINARLRSVATLPPLASIGPLFGTT